nr:TadE family protein [Arthrobacter sp. 35W]
MDFVLVSALLTVLFLAVVQLALVLHVRNTVVDAASSGARYGTLADRNSGDAQERTAMLITNALGPGYAREVSTAVEMIDGVQVLTVTVQSALPVVGLLGPAQTMTVSGHAALAP